ncbi:GNAT family N-acetyltransferase [Sphingomonas sp. MG17]|uniref:GNAT family N-acetyltransferase n=1 Tax=Sphingomonas tagetis TaxID=2949092 RepID=A0A9X2KKX9_9SPHN|nr:GNAT family N-acetyltransferase [Sphingomonas tagetis]MCP3730092.1 GNAT family N-acetyltransferase [Sphingomonas tagetis]
MTAPRPTALSFQIGARTLMAVERSLVRVPVSLDEAREGRLPVLPPLPDAAHGYVVTSLPEERLDAMVYASGRMIGFVRQRYTRYHADLTGSFDGYLAALSGNARQGVRRKAKKVAQASGGTLDVRRFRTADELAAFHEIARGIARRTYQEKLLGEALPDAPEFVRYMLAKAAADEVRAWLLYVGETPAAYLYCPAQGDTLIYEFVGHDPAFNELSPGAVLQMEAFRDLFEEGRFARFDFTEGEGQHKRQYSTGGVPCLDLLLLRPTVANRVTTAALGGFNRAVAGGKALVEAAGAAKLARKLRRG